MCPGVHCKNLNSIKVPKDFLLIRLICWPIVVVILLLQKIIIFSIALIKLFKTQSGSKKTFLKDTWTGARIGKVQRSMDGQMWANKATLGHLSWHGRVEPRGLFPYCMTVTIKYQKIFERCKISWDLSYIIIAAK